LGNGTTAIQSPANLTFSSNTLSTPKIATADTTASTSSSVGAVVHQGGLSISNTTDATSSTNGGTITTAGGLAVAKKAYIGTDLEVGGNLTVTGTVALPHANLTGLTNDDHTQYTLLAGRTGGQVTTGGTASSNNLTLRSTTNATKGSVILDETTASTSSTTGSLTIAGGVGISNTADASSSTNGGTITSAGGLAVAKKAFIGTDLSVGGNVITGSWNANTISVPFGGTGQTTLTTNSILLGNGTTAIQSPANLTFSTNILTAPKITTTDTTASTSSLVGAIIHPGGLSISNVTDAISSTNGGTFTTAGGIAVAKKAFVGGNLSVGGDVSILGNLSFSGSITLAHSSLTGLTSSDDHTQYLFTAGRIGGQITTGGTASGNNLTLRSTSNATKGSILLDETTASTSSISGCLRLSGGLGISNATDATSVINGGSITTAGGVGIAKQLFVGANITSGTITITNSTQNILNINCQGSTINPARILFTNSGGTGDFIISGDGGDIYWQGGGGRALQMAAYHEIRLSGGRATTAPVSFVAGSNATFNTIVQNLNDSIALRVQGNVTQIQNLTQWVSSRGTIYSFVDSVGNFTVPVCNFTNYSQMTSVAAPSNPGGGQFRYYTDISDGLLKSKNSSGIVTIYQPCNTKGDLQCHNGTTNIRLPVSIDGSKLVSDSTATAGVSWNSNACVVISDQKTQGTNGGTFTSGAFVTRTLNTTVSYPPGQTDISLSGNIITLDPGIYRIYAVCPANRCGRHTSRIINNTTLAVLLIGSVIGTSTTVDITSPSIISGILTITATIDIVVQHRCATTRATDGFGAASGFQAEVYTIVNIDKL
jgi:predicted acyltransferase (DUF342 family)